MACARTGPCPISLDHFSEVQKSLDQYSVQFAQNLAIAPSLQLLIDPALNPMEDRIWLFGLRMRLSL